MIDMSVILFNADLENGMDGGDRSVCVGESSSNLPASKPAAFSKLWPTKTAPQKDDASYTDLH